LPVLEDLEIPLKAIFNEEHNNVVKRDDLRSVSGN
jgi:hypothetical protein